MRRAETWNQGSDKAALHGCLGEGEQQTLGLPAPECLFHECKHVCVRTHAHRLAGVHALTCARCVTLSLQVPACIYCFGASPSSNVHDQVVARAGCVTGLRSLNSVIKPVDAWGAGVQCWYRDSEPYGGDGTCWPRGLPSTNQGAPSALATHSCGGTAVMRFQ